MMRVVLRPPQNIVVHSYKSREFFGYRAYLVDWAEKAIFYEQILSKPILIAMEIEDVYPFAGYAKSINFTLIPDYNFLHNFVMRGAKH